MSPIAADTNNNRAAYAALAAGKHSDPFAVLGVHRQGVSRVVRAFQPKAESVKVIDTHGEELVEMERVHRDGVFAAIMPPRLRHYLLRLTTHSGHSYDIEDPYRFPPTLGDLDLYLLGEGSDKKIYDKLGAQVRVFAGIRGTRHTFDSLWFVAESEEGALTAPEPSSAEERAMPRRKWLTAVTRVRSGSIVALKIED